MGMILTYHEITSEPSRYVYSVSRPQFEAHVNFCLSPDVLFTFDDGHVSHYHHALPVLRAAGVRGLFFITAGWTGVRPECMDWAQLSELCAQGHSIGAHGWTHELLHACTDAKLREEIRWPKWTLEDRLGVPVEAISMPGGRCNDRVLQACLRSGYKNVYTSNPFARPTRVCGMEVLGRFMVKRHMGTADLRRFARSLRNPVSAQRIVHQAKRCLRVAVGDAHYQRLWSFMGAGNSRAAINGVYANAAEAPEKPG